MPLQWDIKKTRFWRERKKKKPHYSSLDITLLGVKALHKKIGGYDYSFTPVTLDRELAAQLKSDFEAEMKQEPRTSRVCKFLVEALPWFIGARFIRSR